MSRCVKLIRKAVIDLIWLDIRLRNVWVCTIYTRVIRSGAYSRREINSPEIYRANVTPLRDHIGRTTQRDVTRLRGGWLVRGCHIGSEHRVIASLSRLITSCSLRRDITKCTSRTIYFGSVVSRCRAIMLRQNVTRSASLIVLR